MDKGDAMSKGQPLARTHLRTQGETQMTLPVLGIDIAKETFEVALRVEEGVRQGTFANDLPGYRKLADWLKKRKAEQVHACLEATGRYGEDLAQFLFESGHTVSVVNPLKIRAHATSQMARNKTDRLDAQLIADFCAKHRPPAWTPPAPEIRELQELVRQYDNLQATRQQVRNRLAAGLKSVVVQDQLKEQLAFIEHQIEELKRRLREHIQRHPQLKQRQDLLESINGIGEITAAKLQALDLPRFEDARAVAAYAGVHPRQYTSGTSVRRKSKLCKLSDPALRKALYLPAVSAQRFNPVVRQFCARLAARGKCKMAVIGAAMHKLLTLAYGVLKSGKPFDPNYALPVQFAS